MNDFTNVMPDLEDSEAAPRANEMLAEIEVYVGKNLITKYEIEHGEYIIGRDISCPIFVDADLVSRHHARLTFNAFELVIEDLGSSNGVFIDGVQVQLPTRIRLDQEVQIGSSRLFVRLREAAAKMLAAALWDKDLGLAPVREQLEGKKYKVITTINRGGMGVILQARDLRIRRTVAMKVMKTSNQFSRENVLRFIDEAQLTGQLEHPNIVPVYELGIDEQGETFYTMKFVKGTTLDDVLRGIRNGKQKTIEKYPLGTLLTIFQKVCDGVAFAHAKGVVHRDLKPENIMIGSYGEVLVMDWGLAKNMTSGRRENPAENAQQQQQPEAPAPSAPVDALRGFETMHGLIVGTPPYISPEQARGELDKIDGRSDIYVLGAILYAILTLRAPVEGDTVDDVVEKIVSSKITPPTVFNQPAKVVKTPGEVATPQAFVLAHCPGKKIPDGLSAVTMKAMGLEPEQRYQNVEDLQADIAAFQNGFAPKAERASALKHILLFAGRHTTELAIFGFFFIAINVLIIGFFVQLTREKDRAQANEQKALQSEHLAAARLEQLKGTAPTYADEAVQLMDDQRLPEALEKIEYAIAQIPNEPSYHELRGNILQVQLRLDEAIDAYQEALRLKPDFKEAKVNLDLSKKLLGEIGNEQPKQGLINDFYLALIAQGRKSGALALEKQFGIDRQRWAHLVRDLFDKRGMAKQHFETNADNTVSVDFTKGTMPDFKKLHGMPVSGLVLDDTRTTDIVGLKGLQLQQLSIGHTVVRDLSPLIGMPLRILGLDGTPVDNLGPLHDLPLEVLKMSGCRNLKDLTPLQGLKLEQLTLNLCHQVKDLSPLRGMPLQTVGLNGTAISDLMPLTESPIRELNLEGCNSLTNLHPLMTIATLESVIIPAQCKDIDFLRQHPSIKRLSYKRITQTAEDFWKERDAKKAAAEDAN